METESSRARCLSSLLSPALYSLFLSLSHSLSLSYSLSFFPSLFLFLSFSYSLSLNLFLLLSFSYSLSLSLSLSKSLKKYTPKYLKSIFPNVNRIVEGSSPQKVDKIVGRRNRVHRVQVRVGIFENFNELCSEEDSEEKRKKIFTF